MALGAVLGAALTDHSARVWGIFLDNVDVSSEPAATKRYGVAMDTVFLRVAGPGGVSSLDFTIDDPLSLITPADGQTVRFYDFVTDAPMFTGWVESYTGNVAFGTQGRTWKIKAVGPETLLDWYVTGYDVILPSLGFLLDAIQSLAAACSGIGELRTYSGSDTQGLITQPVGQLNGALNSTGAAVTVPAGTTLREGINTVAQACIDSLAVIGIAATVDQHLGLRVWLIKSPLQMPNGDGSLTLGSGGAYTNNLDYTVDGSSVVRQVRVVGTGVTTTVADGTGKRGRSAVLSDATITTSAGAITAGLAYLTQYAAGVKGRVGLDENLGATPTADTIFTKLQLTDTATGATGTYDIGEIAISFFGSGRRSVISFGGLPPSGASLIRRLTRAILS